MFKRVKIEIILMKIFSITLKINIYMTGQGVTTQFLNSQDSRQLSSQQESSNTSKKLPVIR